MSSAPSIAAPNPGRTARTHGLARRVALDLGGVLVTAIVALAAGTLINRFSSRPLPLVYQTPEQRFDAELTSLIAAPPFAIAPAASIGLTEFRSEVENKSALIFDARSSPFFAQGHVPGAMNLTRDDFAHHYRSLTDVLKNARDTPIIVYCSGGACHDSFLVANVLLTLGFGNVRVFTGGWEEWSAAGLPVSRGS